MALSSGIAKTDVLIDPRPAPAHALQHFRAVEGPAFVTREHAGQEGVIVQQGPRRRALAALDSEQQTQHRIARPFQLGARDQRKLSLWARATSFALSALMTAAALVLA